MKLRSIYTRAIQLATAGLVMLLIAFALNVYEQRQSARVFGPTEDLYEPVTVPRTLAISIEEAGQLLLNHYRLAGNWPTSEESNRILEHYTAGTGAPFRYNRETHTLVSRGPRHTRIELCVIRLLPPAKRDHTREGYVSLDDLVESITKLKEEKARALWFGELRDAVEARIDEWGNQYLIRITRQGQPMIVSVGPDRLEGGNDDQSRTLPYHRKLVRGTWSK